VQLQHHKDTGKSKIFNLAFEYLQSTFGLKKNADTGRL